MNLIYLAYELQRSVRQTDKHWIDTKKGPVLIFKQNLKNIISRINPTIWDWVRAQNILNDVLEFVSPFYGMERLIE